MTTGAGREERVTRAFVDLAGCLAGGEDVLQVLELLTRECAELLSIASAGLLLADRQHVLHVMAASTANTLDLEIFQVQRQEGPCQDCYSSGAPVLVPDLALERERWPVFVPAALEAGFRSVHAVPMRLRQDTLGALGLFGETTGALAERDVSLAQAMADVASVAVVQDRSANDREAVNAQLQHALNSRVVLEQARGLIAQSGDLDMADAFAALRQFSRDRNAKLSDVAEAIVTRTLPAAALLEVVRPRSTDQA